MYIGPIVNASGFKTIDSQIEHNGYKAMAAFILAVYMWRPVLESGA